MMRKRIIVTLTAAAAVLLAAHAATAAGMQVKVSAVKGNPSYERAGVSAAIEKGTMLSAGDIVITPDGAEATLTWGKNHMIKIYPLSKFVVEEASITGGRENSTMLLESGKLFARAGKLSEGSEFAVRTPIALAGVRGSEIFVTSAPGLSSFTVISGAFEITTEGLEVVLNENYQIDIGATPEEIETAEPVPVGQAQLDELRTEADTAYQEAEETPESVSVPGETGEGVVEAVDATHETVEESIDESVINDTIVNPAEEDVLGDDLAPGTGGAIITIE